MIHTVGPVWRGGDQGEAEVLASCYRRSLAVAAGLPLAPPISIGFPAISTGIFGYPPEAAADVAVATLRAALTEAFDDVVLVAFDAATLGHYQRLLAG